MKVLHSIRIFRGNVGTLRSLWRKRSTAPKLVLQNGHVVGIPCRQGIKKTDDDKYTHDASYLANTFPMDLIFQHKTFSSPFADQKDKTPKPTTITNLEAIPPFPHEKKERNWTRPVVR
mmetsp:Transcript_15590/g.23021  ORF Transcript_15590/g.23021 Transcript_15590/m.23021 type:complete len:118 (+) Transcript_15590:410-763(+)